MIVLGLTGSIGMGKSTTAAMFARCGVPVHDSDAVVHVLYRGEAVAPIEAAFPGTTGPGGVDRQALSGLVLDDPAALGRLEAIVHPLVAGAERRFRAQAHRAGHRLCLVDVPLLLENGGQDRVDAVVVVTASAAVQRERVLARKGMTEARLEAILARQMPDAQKRRRAHFLVDTGFGLASAERQVGAILRAVAGL